jgi:hypothetical protein
VRYLQRCHTRSHEIAVFARAGPIFRRCQREPHQSTDMVALDPIAIKILKSQLDMVERSDFASALQHRFGILSLTGENLWAMYERKDDRCDSRSCNPMHDLAPSGKQCIKSSSCDSEGRSRVKIA